MVAGVFKSAKSILVSISEICLGSGVGIVMKIGLIRPKLYHNRSN